jgi:hypothetical protein|tara:strand:- start:240 stop:524 length:285 start_codon:yes stop_codon:yes gene_type:complete
MEKITLSSDVEKRTTTYRGRKIPRRAWKVNEDKGRVTYDDVDGDDLGHGAAGVRDWTRATSDEGTSGEEVGEELTRKDRGEGALLLVYRGSIGV